MLNNTERIDDAPILNGFINGITQTTPIEDKKRFISKRVAYRLIRREKLKTDFHFIKSTRMAESIVSASILINSIREKLNKTIGNNPSEFSNLVKRTSEILNIENELEYDLLSDHFKRECLDQTIKLISHKLNRLPYDETFLWYEDEDSFWNGAYFVLSEVISIKDRIPSADRIPHEDTQDYDLDSALSALEAEMNEEGQSEFNYEEVEQRWCV